MCEKTLKRWKNPCYPNILFEQGIHIKVVAIHNSGIFIAYGTTIHDLNQPKSSNSPQIKMWMSKCTRFSTTKIYLYKQSARFSQIALLSFLCFDITRTNILKKIAKRIIMLKEWNLKTFSQDAKCKRIYSIATSKK